MSIPDLTVANDLVLRSAKMSRTCAVGVAWAHIAHLTTPNEMLYPINLGCTTTIPAHYFDGLVDMKWSGEGVDEGLRATVPVQRLVKVMQRHKPPL